MDKLFKFFDIALIGLFYFFGGIAVSVFINYTTLTYGELSNKDIDEISTKTVFFQLCIEIIMITFFTVLLKSLVKYIPFYIHNFVKYKGYKLLNKNGNILLSFALISYVNEDLNNKLTTFLSRIGIYKNLDNPK